MVFCLTGSMEPPARGWGSGGSSLGWAAGRDQGRGAELHMQGRRPALRCRHVGTGRQPPRGSAVTLSGHTWGQRPAELRAQRPAQTGPSGGGSWRGPPGQPGRDSLSAPGTPRASHCPLVPPPRSSGGAPRGRRRMARAPCPVRPRSRRLCAARSRAWPPARGDCLSIHGDTATCVRVAPERGAAGTRPGPGGRGPLPRGVLTANVSSSREFRFRHGVGGQAEPGGPSASGRRQK